MFLNPASQQQPTLQRESLPYNTVESLLDDVSKQIANSNMTRRYSRGAQGQRVGGGSMRVVKPSSTSNSPRNSACLNRRRTVMGHTASYRRQLGTMDHNTTTSDFQTQFEGMPAPSRTSRPVSWHPSSQMPTSMYSSAYPIVDYGISNGFGGYELPMTPAVYSGYTSPTSTFSPISQPFTSYDQPYPYTDDSTYISAVDNNNDMYNPYQPSSLRQQTIGQEYFGPAPMDESFMYSDFNWANFAANGFNNTTAPPTPENFLSSQNVERTFEVEDAIPYHPLEEAEDDGEELIGMGLYDAPEKNPSCDPQLDSYRTSLMQQMFGAAYRPIEPITTGKGLKLEDAWVPPPSEDEDDEEDADSEDDAEGSPAADEVSNNASRVNDVVRAFGKEIDSSVCSSAPVAQQDMYAGWV